MSQDVFQMKMDLIMERCPGVISIHNDIVVYGTSNEDHDANLINLLNVAQVEGLVLNSKKLELKRPRVSLMLMGPRIVILSCLHEEYLQRLHQGHLSATKVQQNARQHLYWPGLDADIVDYTRRCQESICRSQPPKEPLQAHDVPQEPWERIAMDYFYMNGRLYILICDYFSKFPFLFQVKTTSFANLRTT